MSEGWIKLHRQLVTNGWLKNHKLFTFWIYCLLKATHKPIKVIVGYQEVHLEAGQFIFGRRKAVKEIGLSEQEIRTCVDSLRKRKNLTIKSTHRFSIITIMNWDIYQGSQDESNPLNNPVLTQSQPHTRIKELNKKTLQDSANPAVKEFLSFFATTFKEYTGKEYFVNWGKDSRLVKGLLKVHSLLFLKDLIRIFFKSKDEFILKSGHTIGVFHSQINKLIEEEKRKAKEW